MIHRVAAVLALLCLAVPATAQYLPPTDRVNSLTSEERWAWCKGSKDADPSVTIAACTALIQAGVYSGANLSILFMNRGIAYAKTEQRQLALNDWVQALSLDRTNSLIYYNRGLMFVSLNELDSALRDAERGLQIQPQVSFRYHLIHAEVLRRRGQFADAAIQFEKMFRLPLDDAQQAADFRALQAANEQAKRCGDADAGVSIAACTAVINDRTITPEAVARAYNTRAVAHGRNDNWEQAVRDHDESIRLNPYSAVFYSNRGIASLRLGTLGQASRDFEQSLSLDPKGLGPINGQGVLARQLMDYPVAVERFTAAIAYTPEPPPDAIAIFVANRGMTYLLMEKYDEALIDLNRALSLDPRSAFALFSRGVLRIRKGDVVGGEADIAAAKAVQSDIEVFMARRHLTQPARPTAGEIGTAEAKTRLEEYMRSWQAINGGFLYVRQGTGKLGINKTSDWEVDLAGGIEYVFLGAGDNGAQDINFTLKAMGSDTVLLQDVNYDALPVIRFTPAATGTFVLTVRMVSCAGESCNLHVVLLAKSGSPKQ